MTARGFGYLPDPADARDVSFAVARPPGARRPDASYMHELVREVRDQGRTSSCVGFACASALELRRAVEGKPDVRLSPLGLYWPARAVDGLQRYDGGSHIRSAMRVMHRLGVPREDRWPFRSDLVNERPSIEAEIGGLVKADGQYVRITSSGAQRLEDVLDALAAGCPVVLGTLVNDAFMEHRGTGTIPMPRAGDRFYGGHAVYLAGYRGEEPRMINSWGTTWGDKGQAWLDPGWITAATTQDVWALRGAA